MKSIIKLLVFTIFSISVEQVVFAQDADKTVTLIVTGSGKTLELATKIALRTAIEQAFGIFISSKTEILNDNLISEELVSVANGHIQKYETISEIQIPDEGFTISVKATVSVTKLTSFAVSRGLEVEFKGGLFAFNINQQILNEKNEIIAIEDLSRVVRTLSESSFDYTIKVSDPIAVNADNEKWNIPLEVSVFANQNMKSMASYMLETLRGLSLSNDEANNYIKLGKIVYPVSFAADHMNYSYLLLRKEESIKKLLASIYYFNFAIQNFKIDNGFEKFPIDKFTKDLVINDKKFSPFILKVGACMQFEKYSRGSVFFNAYSSDGYQQISFSTTPLLDWKIWERISRQWRGCGYGWSEYYIGYDFRAYSTRYPYGDFFDNNFRFVKQLSSKFIDGQSGLVISFDEISTGKEIVNIKLNEFRTLAEINKISGYKVVQFSE